MKKYRLKEEVKKYIKTESVRDAELTESHWSISFGLAMEALEEVDERIELKILSDFMGSRLIKKNGAYFTDQEKELCEKALNGELADFKKMKGFFDWVYEDGTVSANRSFSEHNFKEYLNQKK